ncbi:MAG: FAD:protein FMN transferase [Prevotellaceae bacterium]|jgi:thiamine biosynthesis lipoprotein|nr:FAD:protein FMN transferase [Prevotellaceae bacterium]
MDKKRILTAVIFFVIALGFILWQRESPEFVKDEGAVFGTFYSITCKSPDGKSLQKEIEEVLQSVNASLSMFNDSSTISKINRNEDVETDEIFEKVFFFAQKISQKTDGAFDITVAPLVNLWGFGLKNRENVTAEMIDSARQFVGYQNVILENHKLIKSNPNVMLDAGAIAKGFACDLVADFLKKRKIKDFCIEIGGEIVVSGKNPKNKLWNIGINKPIESRGNINNDIEKEVKITDCAMATSGNYRNFYEKDGKKFAHTINPKTGSPVSHNLLSATIIAKDCMTADAFATACMVVGLESSVNLCKNNPEIRGIFIYEKNGKMEILDTK